MAEREFALPDVAMELPSYVPDDDWDSGAGPSRLHPFGAEVKLVFLKKIETRPSYFFITFLLINILHLK